MEKAVKALAWSPLGVSILFVILAMTALFRWKEMGAEQASMLAWWGAVPLLGLAILLAVAVLVTSIFTADS